MGKSPRVPAKRATTNKQRVQKIDEMFRSIEAAIFMHVDDQPDAIYFASLLLTAAKNVFTQFVTQDRAIEAFETVLAELRKPQISH